MKGCSKQATRTPVHSTPGYPVPGHGHTGRNVPGARAYGSYAGTRGAKLELLGGCQLRYPGTERIPTQYNHCTTSVPVVAFDPLLVPE
eukprot:1388558-Rhodomonas_salina.2